jgi:HD superfamily phosphohydrolase
VQGRYNKKKIINDPVYGFVSVSSELIFDLIGHPWFQRLRRIKQLGLSHYVYPGAFHSRFQHVIGAMSLTAQTVDSLRSKGVEITEEEKEAVCAAVLLHDMGHGPFSHTLEGLLIKDVAHEEISLAFMNRLNREFQGKLEMCISIFTGAYHKKFLHQLVSSQLDMDRLDYLRRDSFYTGVQEGVIGHDRIINMLNVHDDEMVIDEKGIYSIEKFLIARRLMYWQVYLHKTVIAVETLLVRIIERARKLASESAEIFCTPTLHKFLYNPSTVQNVEDLLDDYSRLDDIDVEASVKVWCDSDDRILSTLCTMLRDRRLPRTVIRSTPFSDDEVTAIKEAVAREFMISAEDACYFVYSDSVYNKAYNVEDFHINVLYRDGTVADITRASDQYNISALASTVTKYFLCYPKKI